MNALFDIPVVQGLYLVVVWLMTLVALGASRMAGTIHTPPVVTSLVVVFGLTYVSCLVPGALGQLYVVNEYVLFIVLSLTLGGLALARTGRRRASEEKPSEIELRVAYRELPLVAVGLWGMLPLLVYALVTLPRSLRHPETPLLWDAVTYHLPGFIEFYQRHTLWSQEGPYQSYSFGFELIGNFLSQPFHAHWGLILANVAAILLYVSATTSLAAHLASECEALGQRVNLFPCLALAIGGWSKIFPDSINDPGKNDIFMTACLLAALGFLVAIGARRDGVRGRESFLVGLVSVSVGLAFATKPTALPFVPFFAGGTWYALKRSGTRSGGGERYRIGMSLAVLLVSLLLGGFWLVRNLMVYGRLSPLTGAWKLSLIANLWNPALYEIKLGSLLFLGAASAVLPGLVLLHRLRAKGRDGLGWLFLVAFHLVALASFAAAPHAIFHEDLNNSVWKLRLGMPLFASAALIYGFVVVQSVAELGEWQVLRGPAPVLTLVSALALAIPLRWGAAPVRGLPGYEEVREVAKTGVYAWVQEQKEPLRIYSAGLRPYGLYGEAWQNVVFYDLHSMPLSPLGDGKARIAAIVEEIRPNLIVISIDPHWYSGPPVKPQVVEWMRASGEYFEEVYSDAVASGFQVKSPAHEGLRPLVPADYELRMGG